MVAQKAGSGSGSMVTGVVSKSPVLVALYGFADARIQHAIRRMTGTFSAEFSGG